MRALKPALPIMSIFVATYPDGCINPRVCNVNLSFRADQYISPCVHYSSLHTDIYSSVHSSTHYNIIIAVQRQLLACGLLHA